MDNADLERLTISPGKFSPVFHPNVTEYSVSLGSDVKQLKIDPLTSDCGASYSVSGGAGKIVNLLEGETTSIKIEVTAEDGSTIKNYFIHASRLSAKEAVLNDLQCSVGNLSPSFAPNIQNYSLSVPFSLSFIEITPSAADSKAVLKLNGREDLKVPIQLNFGETQVEIEVTSPDRSTSKLYTIKVCKQHLLRYASFINKPSFTKAECPVCLGIPHRPKSIAGSHSGHVYCKSCIDELTRTSKQDPLDDSPLQGEWGLDEFELDKELSSLPTYCVFQQWGCTEKPVLHDLGNHIIHCEYRPVIVDKSSELVSAKDLNTKSKDSTTACSDCNRPVRTNEIEWHKIYMCTSKKNTAVMHKVEVRTWEKKIQQETSEKSAEKLMFTAKGVEEDYLKAIPKHGCAGQFSGDVTPPQLLNSAAELYATAIKLAPKDARLHFFLAQIYEEIYYCQDLYGLKHQTTSEVDLDFNLKSKESSKEDDIQALCEMRGVGRNASLSLQLKAIDEEYHYLLEQGRSDKAEYVQQLYAFKSKQTLKGDKASKLAVNGEEPLGKAYLKYMDALVCGVDNYLYSLYVGKMLVFQGKYDEAVSRLQVATGLKPTNTESRFYLGLALAQQTSGVGDRKEEAIKYLSEGIEYLLNNAREEDENRELVASKPIKLFNIHCLQAFLILADLVRETRSLPIGVMSAVDAYHSAAIVSTRVLSSLVSRGDTYHAVEWTLFQAHSSLLQFALEAEKENKPIIDQTLVTRRCDNLSALIKSSTIPLGKQLLSLQEKTCQQAVLLQPSNSRSIYLLGDAQLRCYDSDPAASGSKDRLQECEDSYRVSIELEGKPSGGKTIPGKICQQKWYKEHQTKLQLEKKASNTPQKTATASKTGGMSGKATLPVRGGGVSARKRGATSNVGHGSPCTRAGASTRPSTTRSRASPAKSVSMQSRTIQPSSAAKSSVSPTKTQSAHKSGSCARTNSHSQPPQIPDKHSEKEAEIPVGPLNKPAYQPRLGLARVLVRKGANMEEIRKLYEEVISLAPEFHDAYIELADSLIKTNPMKAVDVYSKYPFKENQSFDDAYIHGEIVRIIMKQEKYDDPRLGPNLISLGKTMGLTVIEKYVETLDKTFKYSKLLCQVYASVHGKDVDDPDLQQFFKFKCWI